MTPPHRLPASRRSPLPLPVYRPLALAFLTMQTPLRSRERLSSTVIRARVNTGPLRGGLWEFSTDQSALLFPPPHDRHLRGISRVPLVFAFSLRLAAGAPVRLR